MASFFYNKAKKLFLDGTLDWDSQTFKAMLVTSAYTANPDHDFISSASAAELSGTGYAGGFAGSGRKTLTTKTVTESDADDRAYIDCDDVTWTAINAGTIAGMIIVREVATDANSYLVAYLELTAAQPTNGGDVTIVIPTNGWGYI
jgi:hypothetical protein